MNATVQRTAPREESRRAIPSVTVVTLNRDEDQKLVVRFLYDKPVWGAEIKEVSLSPDLAEQLLWLLADELDILLAD